MANIKKIIRLTIMAGIAIGMPAIGQSLKAENSGRVNTQIGNTSSANSDSNEKTGKKLTIVSLIIGAGALGYSIYSNRVQTKKIELQATEIEKLKDRISKKGDTGNDIATHKNESPKYERVNKETVPRGQPDTKSQSQKQSNTGKKTAQTIQTSVTPQKTIQTIEKYYANATLKESGIILTIGGNEMADYLPFELRSDNIGQCSVYFNDACFTQIVDTLETRVLPYSDCKISNKSRPSRITTLKPGKAIKNGEIWKMTSKPKLEVL